jgi:hypothetical protein
MKGKQAMTDGIEGVGEAVTGGLIARAVEPRAGEAHDGHAAGRCLNCGTALRGEYCHVCGQAAHVHRSLSAIWHDIAHSVLHFEGKFWRTLPLLAWRPGDLTRRYVEGERARFISPMALFLFSVFLMFAVFTAVGGPFSGGDATRQQEAAQEVRSERAEIEARLAELEAERERLAAAGDSITAIDRTLAEVRQEADVLATAANIMATAGSGSDGPTVTVERTGIPGLDAALQSASDNPALLLYKVQANAYKFSWALIPISVPFVWLMFLHRRRYRQYRAYDHTVFVTYSIAFMSLGLVALTLLRPLGLGAGVAGALMLLVPPVHMYRQLRGAYGLGWFSALWRTILLVNFAFIAGGLFLSLLLTMGAMS